MGRNLGTIFLPPVPKMYNNDFDDKVGIVRNDCFVCVDFIDV